MERARKPAPLADPIVFPTEEPPPEDQTPCTDPGPMQMQVRNTFVDFKTDSNVPQLLTAPGKFVGRLAGFATATPTGSMSLMGMATPTPSSRAVISLPTPMNATPHGMRTLSPVTETAAPAPAPAPREAVTVAAPSEKASLCLAQLVPAEPARGVPVYTGAAPVMTAGAEAGAFAAAPMQQMLAHAPTVTTASLAPAQMATASLGPAHMATASLAPAQMPTVSLAPAQMAPAPLAAPSMMAPPMHAPMLPTELGGMPFAPPKSPQLPKELLSRAMPPPPATQAMPLVAQQPQQLPQLQMDHMRQQLEGGTLIEVKPLVEAVSPPQFAPPSYSIALQQIATPSGSSPPPMFAPSCSTPSAGQMNRFIATASYQAPASASAPSGTPWSEVQSVTAGGGLPVPPTPQMMWPATPY